MLHAFAKNGADGAHPTFGLIVDKLGNLYGTTVVGGSNGLGTAFKITSNGTETVLHSFANDGTDGYYPYTLPVLGRKNALYGTTPLGGANGAGMVFKIVP